MKTALHNCYTNVPSLVGLTLKKNEFYTSSWLFKNTILLII